MTPDMLNAKASLPRGFRVLLRGDVVRADGGRVLVGGSPVRAVRLSSTAQELLRDGGLTVEGRATGDLARRLLDANLANPVIDHVEVALADLTVVIPVRDRAEQLGRCLAALSPLRVVVVDDASLAPCDVAEVVRRHGAQLLSLATNLGPAGARNAGLSQVATPLVAFVDSDVQVSSAALLELARHCHDRRVALVGPRVVGRMRPVRGRSKPRWFERYDMAASSLDLGRSSGAVRPGAAVGWLPSACVVGRTSHLREPLVQGFEEGWRVAEDVDLVWRLVDAGLTVRFAAEVEAHHDVRPSLATWLGRKFLYGTGGAALAARHGDKVAPATLSPLMAVGAAVVLVRRWWSAPIAVLIVATAARSVARRLPMEHGSRILAVRLAARGLAWSVRQEAGLLLRHWWPLAALAAPFNRPVRRALTTAVLVDLAVFLSERPGLNPVTVLTARRLDDMAYGSGLWWGAARRRDFRCLRPRRSS